MRFLAVLLAVIFLVNCSPLTKGQAIGLATGLMIYKVRKQDSVKHKPVLTVEDSML